MPLVPALGRQRQTGLCEFKACLTYIVSSDNQGIIIGVPCLNKTKQPHVDAGESNSRPHIGKANASPSEKHNLNFLAKFTHQTYARVKNWS